MMKTLLTALVSTTALLLAACGEDASTGSSAKKDDGLVPNSGIEASPGVKGRGKIDSSGKGEAGDLGGGPNRTRKDGT